MKENIVPATALNKMLCWNPGTDQIALVEWPDNTNSSRAYENTALAASAYVHNLEPTELKLLVSRLAIRLIVHDGCDPQAVHRALLPLEEYRDGLSEDML